MAYEDWEANVSKDGARRRDRENRVPHEGRRQHHAVLGEEDALVRLCAEGYQPVLYVRGEQVELDPFCVARNPNGRGARWTGTVEGYTFAAELTWGANGKVTRVDLALQEPGGARWASGCAKRERAGHGR